MLRRNPHGGPAARKITGAASGDKSADEYAVAIAGSQKTLPTGVLIASELARSAGLAFAIFPMLMFHASQLFIDAWIVQAWHRREVQRLGISDPHWSRNDAPLFDGRLLPPLRTPPHPLIAEQFLAADHNIRGVSIASLTRPPCTRITLTRMLSPMTKDSPTFR
ncbi:MAG: bile acid:sodium symporter [Planctomycetales bacterium]